MSNLTVKMTQTSIDINIKLQFSKIWGGETLNVKMNIFQMKIFKKITFSLFIIYSFSELKVLVSSP